jgi:signal transduction histidine kinase
MNAMLDRLQAASDRERRFVADASHELRSPIASLRTQIEVQQKYSASNGEQEDLLSSQLAEVSRMERLVRDLLVLARADERKMAARLRPVRLQDLVLEEVAGLAGPGRPHVDVTGVDPVTILGDPAGLGRVVRNVLENALRHARSSVVVTVRTDGDDVELRVANDGPEIPTDASERIFERFTRLDEGRARDEGGAGLGLAIVREIVLAHGGRIWIDDVGPGACFVICLPVRTTKSS